MRIVLLLCFLSASSSAFSQTNNYWQQRIDYNISVDFDESEETLTGYQEVEYFNHSPDTLSHLYLHLFANALSSNSTPYVKQRIQDGFRGIYFEKLENRPSIEITDVKVDNGILKYEFLRHNEFLEITLPRKLNPGESLKLEINFITHISKLFSRFGKKNDTYYNSFWYPKIVLMIQTGGT